MTNPFRVGIVQLRTEPERNDTYEKAQKMIFRAAENGANVIVLPEMWDCPYQSRYFREAASRGHEETVRKLSSWAKATGTILIGGSTVEVENGCLYNTCFVFDKNGNLLAKHRKVHLFDVDLPGMSFRESDTFTPGCSDTVFDTEYGRFGVAVCFDVRFPELFRKMARKGAEVIFLPAQFNMTTGPAHWEPTIRMRAVDNEVYMVAASAAKCDGFSYECWGHSMVADPYGEVKVSCEFEETVLFADIDPERIRTVRSQLPTFLHLREDVYTVAD